MAKAGGGKGGLIGAVLRAGAAIMGAGVETGAKQRSTISALSNSLATVSHMIGSICSAAVQGKGNPKALENLLSVAKSFEVMLRQHQDTRARMRRDRTERLELKTPEPVNPATAPQPRRAVPKMAPHMAPTPKPTFSE